MNDRQFALFVFFILLIPGGLLFAIGESRLSRLEALHENERGVAVLQGTSAEGSPETADAAPALTGEPRRGYTSTHDMMLDKFDVQEHNHGKTACTYHLGGYRFTFKWDGERWEQVEAVRED